ncbi:hypothetical protein [Streptomyces sp. MJP52]|nr:hypothetical protein [Streptomyces sp. MJP52]MDH6224310.1 hypothetical protein [Streptomyces sp. MJP52]
MSLTAWLPWVIAAWIGTSLTLGALLAAAGYRRNTHRTRKEEL